MLSVDKVKDFEIKARTENIHPWNEKATEGFFNVFVNIVCSDGHGQYITGEDKNIKLSNFVVYKRPLLFVHRKKTGAKAVVKEIIEDISKNGLRDGVIKDLFSDTKEQAEEAVEKNLDELLAATSGESLNILLAKQANKEQMKIAERIEFSKGVLVQGPPGTGKTHTIANLIGHFIAQGKTVLVTSEKEKALKVVKEKLPKDVQMLCVALVGGNNKDMETAINGMLDYCGTHNKFDEKKRIQDIREERKTLLENLRDYRNKIYAARLKSHRQYVYEGNGYSANEIGIFLEQKEKLNYIPGSVKARSPLPLTLKEFDELYGSNGELSFEECEMLEKKLPKPEQLISAVNFRKYINHKKRISIQLDEIAKSINSGTSISFDLKKDIITISDSKNENFVNSPNVDSIMSLKQEIDYLKEMSALEKQILCDGSQGHSNKIRWEQLFDEVKNTYKFSDEYRACALGKIIVVDNTDMKLAELKKELNKLGTYLGKGEKVSYVKWVFNPGMKKVYKAIKINGESVGSAEHCNLVSKFLSLNDLRKNLQPKWDQQVANCGSKLFFDLDTEFQEVKCAQIISKCEGYLGWYENRFSNIMDLVQETGISASTIYKKNGLVTADEINDLVIKLTEILPKYLKAIAVYVELREDYLYKKRTIEFLNNEELRDNDICQQLLSNLLNDDDISYSDVYNSYLRIYEKYKIYYRREELLNKLESAAPAWGKAIANRIGIHGKNLKPEELTGAWQWKQFEIFYEEISDENISYLQRKVLVDGETLRRETVNLVCASAWYHLLEKYNGDKKLATSLQAWKQTRKSMGRAQNARTRDLREQGQKLMVECQRAVPAWVMTVDDALTSFDLKHNSFDIIIIDEASQSDLTALPLLYMGKKVIVVGDDKQVSPLAVGVKDADVKNLAVAYLKKFYPDQFNLFDARYSLYDFAGLNYTSLMLREHFRCVPDIIGYCNNLCYDNKILALREANSTPILPAMVNYRVEGLRDCREKTNIKECENIAALFLACHEQPEYQGKTFGIISLLGMDQVRKMQMFLDNRVDGNIIERTKMMVGDAATFQGDERDVVFATMVDSSEGEAMMRKRGEGQYDAYIKRYNVAVSRAKDQLWVVNSLDYKNCLKSGDLRRGLLEYMENPEDNTMRINGVKENADSEFEVRVGKALLARGYDVVQQYPVGSYRIDMIIRDSNIAIECDGEAYHTGEKKVREDMERQTILERLGWNFIRIRGSAFFRNEESCITKVEEQLEQMHAPKRFNVSSKQNVNDNKLLSRVRLRAAQILQEWQEDVSTKVMVEKVIVDDFEGPQNHGTDETEKNKAQEKRNTSNNLAIKDEKPLLEESDKTKTTAGEKSFENTLLAELQSLGNVIDRTSINRTIWVVGQKSLKSSVTKITDKYGLKCTFEPRGSVATSGKSGWIITRK